MSGNLTVVGMDPSLRNWGLVLGSLHIPSGRITVNDMRLVQPEVPTSKQVRQNSKDIHAAAHLFEEAFAWASKAHAVFVEVPIGSQSARAMASYGVCVGVLGSLVARGIPLFELTPTEVKLATTGQKNASKEAMIEWAIRQHPDARWPSHRRNGIETVTAKAEHLADALATIYAGVQSTPFKQMMALSTNINNPIKESHANSS